MLSAKQDLRKDSAKVDCRVVTEGIRLQWNPMLAGEIIKGRNQFAVKVLLRI
jgi:hypothetical protein